MEDKHFTIKHNKKEIYLDNRGKLTFDKKKAYKFTSEGAAKFARDYYRLFNYSIM